MKVSKNNQLNSTLLSSQLLHSSKNSSVEQIKSSPSVNAKEYIKIDEYEYA